jgi:protein-tyrosine phosphatase
MQEAVELAAAHVSVGIDAVVATPHVSPRYRNEQATIEAGLAALNAALADAGIGLHVLPGAEIDLQYGLNLDDASLRTFAFGQGRWLLIESPYYPHPAIETAVLELTIRGHRVLLGHPERSPVFLRDPQSLRRLVDAGVRTQITASSLIGQFGGTVKRYVDHLLQAGIVHTVASDAHNTTRRPPGLYADALSARLGDGATWLLEEAPQAILDGDELPPVIHLAPRRPAGWRRLMPSSRRDG